MLCFVCVPGVYDSLRSSPRTWARIMLTLFVSLSLSNALSLSFSVSEMMKRRQVDNIMRAIEFCIVVVFGLLCLFSVSRPLSQRLASNDQTVQWNWIDDRNIPTVYQLWFLYNASQSNAKRHIAPFVWMQHTDHTHWKCFYTILVCNLSSASLLWNVKIIFLASPRQPNEVTSGNTNHMNHVGKNLFDLNDSHLKHKTVRL